MSILRRPRARADLIDLSDYLDQVRPSLGDQFLDAVERTFALLERMPGIGAPFPLANPRLQGLRHHPVQGFPNHIIIYLPTSDGIEVVRVLHGARDLTRGSRGFGMRRSLRGCRLALCPASALLPGSRIISVQGFPKIATIHEEEGGARVTGRHRGMQASGWFTLSCVYQRPRFPHPKQTQRT